MMTKKTCPLGEDCDLTVAWMAGRESAKGAYKARIDELERLTTGQAEQLEIQGNRIALLSSSGHKQSDRIEELEAKLAKAVEALEGVLGACDQGREIPRVGVGGMTIEANIKGSIYTGVPAWPIEEARTTLAELKEDQ